jgi:hypothetical protein
MNQIGGIRLIGQCVDGDDEGAVDDSGRVFGGHLPRQDGAAELDGVGTGVDLLIHAEVFAGALEHLADVHDVIDRHPTLLDRELKGVHHVFKAALAFIDGIVFGLRRKGDGNGRNGAEQQGLQCHCWESSGLVLCAR